MQPLFLKRQDPGRLADAKSYSQLSLSPRHRSPHAAWPWAGLAYCTSAERDAVRQGVPKLAWLVASLKIPV